MTERRDHENHVKTSTGSSKSPSILTYDSQRTVIWNRIAEDDRKTFFMSLDVPI